MDEIWVPVNFQETLLSKLEIHRMSRHTACFASDHLNLSPREREVLEILYHTGEASAREVWRRLEDRPSYSAVRGTLRVLERKRIVRHKARALRCVFLPGVSRIEARRVLLRHIIHIYFNDSAAETLGMLLELFHLELAEGRLSGVAGSAADPRQFSVSNSIHLSE